MRIALDGPCGAGKSTLGRLLAQRLGYVYIDTGAMYRAVALCALESGVSLDDPAALEALAGNLRMEFKPCGERQKLFVEKWDVTDAIRSPRVSQGASRVSAIPGVRRAMVKLQREMSADTDVVMDGRDIGTVVFPDAEVKFYLDAAVEERAQRRWAEDRGRGLDADYDEILREIRERDHRDMHRSDSPLRRAEDAVPIDSSGLGVEDVLGRMLDHVSRVIVGKRRAGKP
ncbi:MAG: (d)CMP kinase [Acidobacteria bacterium]|nr:(d)CMP kinase [Acidobacteriota bacterium]